MTGKIESELAQSLDAVTKAVEEHLTKELASLRSENLELRYLLGQFLGRYLPIEPAFELTQEVDKQIDTFEEIGLDFARRYSVAEISALQVVVRQALK